MQTLRLCIALTLIGLLLVQAAVVVAAPLEDARNQDQVEHVVKPGENLFRISLAYGTTVNAIKASNGLASTNIHVGQRLVISRGSNTTSPSAGATSGRAASPGGTYIVRRGDTLSRIALRHGVTVNALVSANRLASYAIYVGQQLTVPGTDEAPAAPQSGTYVVRPGDTLSKIAQRFGTTASALSRLNGIANPSAVYAGQVLRLSGSVPAIAAGAAKRVVMDLSEQHLYAYEGERLVYSFVASSGRAPSYTKAGEFRVQSKIPKAYGATWNIWMPSWLGIYWAGSTENGIHALPILPNGQILWAGYLGSPISYGCIVLGTHEAQLLYNWAEIGTPVSIRY